MTSSETKKELNKEFSGLKYILTSEMRSKLLLTLYENSKNINAIFPYLHPDYPQLIEHILINDGSVELILPKNIFKELLFRVNNEVRKNAIKEGKLKVYIFKKELNLYLTACDESMSLGLFKNDGSFDQNRILVSNDPQSNRWACELFEHVKTQVRK